MFEGIIGNEPIKELLEKSIKQNTTFHSYLFVGTQGIGKKMIATQFAKRLLCIEKKDECNCKSCIEFDTMNNPDYLYIEPDGNSIKIEQIRFLQKKIQEKPIRSEKKVYIINDADYMTTEAQNCLLKTLEEPPAFATIILIGANENLFLNTIKSRCMIIKFKHIDKEQIKAYLANEYDITNINENILDFFQGSIGKAIHLKDKQEEYNSIENIVEILSKADIIEVLKKSEYIYKEKDEISEILDYINILLFKKSKTNNLYTNCIKIVENTKKRLKQNANYDMSIDNMLFSIWEELCERDGYKVEKYSRSKF